MNVSVAEIGERPIILTKPRQFAPQAAQAIGEVLGSKTWADNATVILDWQNSLSGINDNSPVMYIEILRRVPQKNAVLRIESRLDVEDVFTADVLTQNLILDIVQEMKEKIDSELVEKGVR